MSYERVSSTPLNGRALLQGALAGALNDRTVSKRIAERHAELDHVRPASIAARIISRDGQVGVAAGDIGDEARTMMKMKCHGRNAIGLLYLLFAFALGFLLPLFPACFPFTVSTYITASALPFSSSAVILSCGALFCSPESKALSPESIRYSANFSRKIPMSLSPRPEMFTITTSDLLMVGARVDTFRDGVRRLQRGDYPFHPREHKAGVERFLVAG